MLKTIQKAGTKRDVAKALAGWYGSPEEVAATLDGVSVGGQLDESLLSGFVYELAAAGLSRRDAGAVAERVRRADRERRGGLRLATPEDGVATLAGPDDALYDLPEGYRVGGDGEILRRGGEERPDVVVAHRPILISARWVDDESGREVVDVSWASDDGWRTETVPRSVAMDARHLVGLSDLGAPVSSVSASEVVRLLRAQVELLPDVAGVAIARSGWVGQDFVAGGTCILGGVPVRVLGDDGARQLASAVKVGGTWEGWLEAVEQVADRPRVMVAIWGAVAAAMLHPLGFEGGIVMHWVAGSSQGKTTSLKAGWSVWGPVGGAGIGSWDATMKWIEERAGYSCDLPTVLDETSHIPERGREAAARLVYALAKGQGRGRGTRGGSDAVKEYRTVVLSTGEAPLTAWCQLEGVAARTLELHGAPCRSAEESRELVWALDEHHGHLGPRVVEWLAGRDWQALKARYKASVPRWASRTTREGVGPRLGAILAALEAAGRLCTSLGVPGDVDETMEYLLGAVNAQTQRANLGFIAWEVLVARIAESADRVCGMTEDGRTVEPARGIVGVRLPEGVAVVGRIASEWLERAGIDPTTARERMEVQGRVRQARVRLPGCRPRCWIVMMDDDNVGGEG